MGASQRRKGVAGEREVIVMLQPVVDEVCAACGHQAPTLKRTGSLQANGGGSDIAGLEWLALEVKNVKESGLRVGEWWQQTLRQCGQQQVPVLAYKLKGKWFVMCFATMHASTHQWSVPVVITWHEWLTWFRARLTEELMKGVTLQ